MHTRRSVSLTLETLTAYLGNARGALLACYGLHDNTGKTLDCLKLVPMGKNEFLGVAHCLVEGVFHLRLVHSTNLINWEYVTTLDTHASQGELITLADGSFWLAYEHDEPNSCFIRLRHYASRTALEKGKFLREHTLGRTLAPTAEGTPSFENIGNDTIRLRFHYYRNGDVDRAASGTLSGTGSWNTQPEAALSAVIEAFGVRGNIGGRCKLTLGKQSFYLQEGQKTKNDWASWGIYLMPTPPTRAVKIPIQTHKGSTSFANPFACALPDGRIVVTFFLQSEGNAPGEAGSLLYVLPPPPP